MEVCAKQLIETCWAVRALESCWRHCHCRDAIVAAFTVRNSVFAAHTVRNSISVVLLCAGSIVTASLSQLPLCAAGTLHSRCKSLLSLPPANCRFGACRRSRCLVNFHFVACHCCHWSVFIVAIVVHFAKCAILKSRTTSTKVSNDCGGDSSWCYVVQQNALVVQVRKSRMYPTYRVSTGPPINTTILLGPTIHLHKIIFYLCTRYMVPYSL